MSECIEFIEKHKKETGQILFPGTAKIVWNHLIKKHDAEKEKIVTEFTYFHEWKTLQSQLEVLQEFVDDCAVSHVESRYKYRAQVIQNKNKKKLSEVKSE